MEFDLVMHDPDILFNTIATLQRDQAVFEANDAACRQPIKRSYVRWVATAGTKPHGRVADEHDTRESAKATSEKSNRDRRYDDNGCLVCGTKVYKQWDFHKSQQGKVGKRVHCQIDGEAPRQQQQQ